MNSNNYAVNATETEEYKREGAIINLKLLPVHTALRVVRSLEGINQPQFVRMLGFSSTAFYSLVENGKAPVPMHLLEKVQAYLYDGVMPPQQEMEMEDLNNESCRIKREY
ncbi:hypothetical protein PDK35_28315 [Bacillus cereus group sp. TH153LC]|uniref:hypothetical protein n=1 Tax=Bacillus cereus group sp. TH153LC TaxID=3018059 RepID=UPI0022E13494|nr:hypothetical protein [Bacillus cereus group sp. TH153LC]MDA1663803.1 hypothetical protein [Bacillus cereus group sp. TH153LC]